MRVISAISGSKAWKNQANIFQALEKPRHVYESVAMTRSSTSATRLDFLRGTALGL